MAETTPENLAAKRMYAGHGVPTEPTLTLHVGTQKSGSTSIQRAMFAYRDRLAAAGTHVARTASVDFTRPHHNLAYEIIDRPRFHKSKGGAAELKRELETLTSCNVLVSSESFSVDAKSSDKYDRIAALADRLGRKLQIVLFLREQLSYLNSIYAFTIRRLRQAALFEPSVRKMAQRPRLDFPAVVQPWSAIADNLIVLPVSGDVVQSFFALFGVEIGSSERANTPAGPKTVEACRILMRKYQRSVRQGENEHTRTVLGRRAEEIKEVTDSFGWNQESFWGFEPDFAAEMSDQFLEDNQKLSEQYGLTFDHKARTRVCNVFDPDTTDAAERCDFDEKRDRLWKILNR